MTLSETAIDAGFAVFANVYDSSGLQVGNMWAGTQTFTLSDPGVYLIQISDANLLKRGTYRIRVRLV